MKDKSTKATAETESTKTPKQSPKQQPKDAPKEQAKKKDTAPQQKDKSASSKKSAVTTPKKSGKEIQDAPKKIKKQEQFEEDNDGLYFIKLLDLKKCYIVVNLFILNFFFL